MAEVVGFKRDKILLMPLAQPDGIRPGALVVNTGGAMRIGVGNQLIGRVLDGLGRPIDTLGEIRFSEYRSTRADAINPLKRKRITESLSLGIKSIDGFMTVGKGQRMGVFAGSGVGKSTLLGMIARNSDADVNVVWVYISNLRKKLTSLDATCEIKASRGVGYSINETN